MSQGDETQNTAPNLHMQQYQFVVAQARQSGNGVASHTLESTTSSMPWKRKSSRGFVFKWLATGMAGNRYIRRYFRPISGQI